MYVWYESPPLFLVSFAFHYLIRDVFSDFTNSGGSIASTLISIAGVGGIIYKAISWLNTQNDRKAAAVKADNEAKAKMLKEENEEKARVLQEALDDRAEELHKVLEQRAVELKGSLEDRARVIKETIEQREKEFKEYFYRENSELKVKLNSVDMVLNKMYNALKERADLTNGNVSNIRNDIADVQDDIDDMYERIEALSVANGTTVAKGYKSEESRGTARRAKDRRSRERRQEIERDRTEQRHGDSGSTPSDRDRRHSR